jgi:hypothetical protein
VDTRNRLDRPVTPAPVLPQGCWTDRQGFIYSTDGRAGTFPVRNGHTYYRPDDCTVCGRPVVVAWTVDPDGGTETVECDYGCQLNPGEPF